MKSRLLVFTAFLFAASHVLAQTPAKPPAAPRAPAAPPAPAAVPPAPPPAPPAPPGVRRDLQPINIKVELTISEEGNATPVKKTVTTVAGDGFSGSVRETSSGAPGMAPVSLNVDAWPSILPNGKIRLTCTIQYSAGQNPAGESRLRTDIRQNLVLILESGKALVISEASDPVVNDRHVTIEVKATILK
jgi:pyruvate/2-oxoglutarate dehydrogenase complex dihydrolipoamide acyltransferase (E2) component